MKRRGFTLIELVITITIVAILSSVVVIAYTGIQRDSRDSTRQGNAFAVQSALEKYYDENGEYPSVRSLANTYPENTGAAVATKLDLNADALLMPNMPSEATNMLTSGETPHDDYISYVGKSDVNDADCQSLPTGGCDEFTLKYLEESGETITIESRHSGRSSGQTASTIAKPSLVVALSDTDVVATATADPCNASIPTAQFSFRYRVNGGSWSTYSAWSTSTTYSIAGTQGSTYDFQAMTGCGKGSLLNESSPESDAVSYTYPLDPPTAPTTTVTLSSGNATATASTVSCAGGTAEYAIRSRTNNGTWSSYSAWSGTRTASQAANQGVRYDYQSKARCNDGDTLSDEAVGVVGTYIHPISTPATPSLTVSTEGDVSTWHLSTTSCPSGTTARYQTHYIGDWGYDSAWNGPYTGLETVTWTTASQGYQYTVQVQTHCYNSNTTSSWSSTASLDYIRPISTPGAPTNFDGTLSADRYHYVWEWTAPTCGPGTRAESKSDMYIYDNNDDSWHWTDTGVSGWHGWFAQGWWSPKFTLNMDPNDPPIEPGGSTRMRVQYICVNATTGRTGSWGPIGTGPMATT